MKPLIICLLILYYPLSNNLVVHSNNLEYLTLNTTRSQQKEQDLIIFSPINEQSSSVDINIMLEEIKPLFVIYKLIFILLSVMIVIIVFTTLLSLSIITITSYLHSSLFKEEKQN